MKIKKFFCICVLVFGVLAFFTWQGVTIFRLGYMVKEASEELRSEEIKRQRILKEYRSAASLEEIERNARSAGMKVPYGESIDFVKVCPKILFPSSGRKVNLLSYLREVLTASEAEAGE